MQNTGDLRYARLSPDVRRVRVIVRPSRRVQGAILLDLNDPLLILLIRHVRRRRGSELRDITYAAERSDIDGLRRVRDRIPPGSLLVNPGILRSVDIVYEVGQAVTRTLPRYPGSGFAADARGVLVLFG